MLTPANMPLAAFDLETTSADPTTCRIVTASIVTVEGAQTTASEWLLNPEIDIPESAAAIHGITTEHARKYGAPYATGYGEIRERVEQLWADGWLVVIMNAPFDLTILDREGARLGWFAGPLKPGPTVDPLVIDKHLDKYRKGGRTLTDLCRVYEVRQDDAHQSTGDCLAAARIAYRLLRHQRMRSVDDVDVLMRLEASWRAEQQDSLRAFWQGRGDERWRTVNGDWPLQVTA